jgi:AAA domain
VDGISLLCYGESKCGKSWLGDTTPAPRLVLDAEGGSRFTPSKKVTWNPAAEAPPKLNGWETCLVPVNSYQSVKQAYEWLYSGQHPFASVVIDSISETQQRCVDDIAGANQMTTPDWGTLLRTVSSLVRGYRDLVTHPAKPLASVMMIAMLDDTTMPRRPLLQGKMRSVIPYYFDLCGYLGVFRQEDGTEFRRLVLTNTPEYVAGERVGGRLGSYVDHPNVSEMLSRVTGWQPEAASAAITK